MAKIILNKKGFKIIEMSIMEFQSIGGLSICDRCNSMMRKGFFIAVLNSSYCEDDFNRWLKSAIRYDEDIPYELSKFKEMKNMLNITN